MCRFALLALCCASALSTASAATLEIPQPYTLQLLDGQSANTSMLTSDRKLNLSAGEHQVVVQFEGTFRDQSDNRLIRVEPVVINLNLKDTDALALRFTYPRNFDAAERYLATQPLTIVEQPAGTPAKVDFFVLPKKEGLQIGRDYQQELTAMGKAFRQTSMPIATAETAAAAVQEKVGSGPVDKNVQTLEMLKYWYNQADVQTRKDFQHWIISQQ